MFNHLIDSVIFAQIGVKNGNEKFIWGAEYVPE
jgi:hypothetical protein